MILQPQRPIRHPWCAANAKRLFTGAKGIGHTGCMTAGQQAARWSAQDDKPPLPKNGSP